MFPNRHRRAVRAIHFVCVGTTYNSRVQGKGSRLYRFSDMNARIVFQAISVESVFAELDYLVVVSYD